MIKIKNKVHAPAMPMPEAEAAPEEPVTITCCRSDTATAAIVDEGITMQDRLGPKAASEFMAEHKVPIEVAVRVLLQPARRRR